jgi:large subunit ribosomal protein L9
MEIILLERIEKLGSMGDVVTVKPGFARNYLLPQKKALRATKENLAKFEQQRVQLEADNRERREEAQAVADRLDGLAFVVIRQASEGGQLYGSVSARDIAEAIGEAGFKIGRQQVQLDAPIKSLGLHGVRVPLHPEVSASVTLNVARTKEEAEIQQRQGRAVIGQEEEQTAAGKAEAGAETAAESAPEKKPSAKKPAAAKPDAGKPVGKKSRAKKAAAAADKGETKPEAGEPESE